MRRLTGLPQVAADIPEGYFSGLGVSSEKCGVNTPTGLSPTAPEQERNPDNIQL